MNFMLHQHEESTSDNEYTGAANSYSKTTQIMVLLRIWLQM